LTQLLAGKLSSDADREEFLKGAGLVPGPATKPPRPAINPEKTGSRPPVAPAQDPRPLTSEDVAQASQLLAVLVGPIAPVLAKRAAKPGSSREQFIAAVAAQLSEGDRAHFLRTLG
jgi:serine/threonine-protein kinase